MNAEELRVKFGDVPSWDDLKSYEEVNMREQIRQILLKEYPPFQRMSPKEQEELIDVECYINNHAPKGAEIQEVQVDTTKT